MRGVDKNPDTVAVSGFFAHIIQGFWPTRADSNRWPSESESDALSSCATGRYYFIILSQKALLVKHILPKKQSFLKNPGQACGSGKN